MQAYQRPPRFVGTPPLLIPLHYVPSALPAYMFIEPDPRLFELCVLTCEALETFALAVGGRPSLQ